MSSSEHIYYQSIRILGIAEGATLQEIKQSYRKLSKEYHPDVFLEDAGEQFKAINAAYSYLKKHPEPPQKNYQPAIQPIHNDYTREEKRRMYWARKKREHELKQQMFQQLFSHARIVILAIALFNILLIADYYLLSRKTEKKLTGKDKVIQNSSRNGVRHSGYTELQFDGGYTMLLDTKAAKEYKNGSTYLLTVTPVFKQIKYLKTSSGNFLHTPSYGVYSVFGFIIAIVHICTFLYFFILKNNDYRLTMLLILVFSFLMQFFLLY